MKNYSAQLGKFIESTRFGRSCFRPQDDRTCVSYYQDIDGLIHSSSMNYSLIGSKAVTIEEFRDAMTKDSETAVTFI